MYTYICKPYCEIIIILIDLLIDWLRRWSSVQVEFVIFQTGSHNAHVDNELYSPAEPAILRCSQSVRLVLTSSWSFAVLLLGSRRQGWRERAAWFNNTSVILIARRRLPNRFRNTARLYWATERRGDGCINECGAGRRKDDRYACNGPECSSAARACACGKGGRARIMSSSSASPASKREFCQVSEAGLAASA